MVFFKVSDPLFLSMNESNQYNNNFISVFTLAVSKLNGPNKTARDHNTVIIPIVISYNPRKSNLVRER